MISASVSAQGLTDSIGKEVLRRVDAQINPGLAIAILRPDKTVQYFNFGVLDIYGTPKVNEHTIFEIGSITKHLHHQFCSNTKRMSFLTNPY